jgi:hypothetical protein
MSMKDTLAFGAGAAISAIPDPLVPWRRSYQAWREPAAVAPANRRGEARETARVQ